MSQTKPFFIPQKEFDLINQMNEELIDEIVGQSVDIYKVNIDRTDENVYGESSTKYYDIGFRVNCLIMYNEPEVTQDEFGVKVDKGCSFIYGVDLDGGVVDTMDSADAAGITPDSFGDLVDITCAANTAACDVEVFVAST